MPAVALAALVVILVDLLRGGLLVRLDAAVESSAPQERWPQLAPAARVLDHMGLRGLTVPLLVVAALALHSRLRTWRPLVVVLGAELALNAVVGTGKLVTARGLPRDGDPALGHGGIIFPSGHAANTALCATLLVHFVGLWRRRRLSRPAQAAAIGVPTAMMTAISLYLGFHWLSDLVAGALVGVLVAWAALASQDRVASLLAARRRRALRRAALRRRGGLSREPRPPQEQEPPRRPAAAVR